MKSLKVSWIIHLFALLHAAVALLCRVAGVEDELLLTILTMTMALLICMRKGFNIEFTAAGIIAVNIIGYLLGNTGATIFSFVLESPFAVHALATALTTEILGWSLVAFTKFLKPEAAANPASYQYLKWMLLAMLAAFAMRIGIIFLLQSNLFAPEDMMAATSKVLSSSFALITLLCLNIIYIRYAGRINKEMKRGAKVLMLTGFMLLASLAGAASCSIGIPFSITVGSASEFCRIYAVTLIAQVSMYCIVFMINYAATAESKRKEEKEKKHLAQYRYQRLKRQVNPHFLFNSLNALDCLVCEEKTQQASTYIHKLAGVYRYMIRSEEEELVKLGDELVFVGMYVDLLKVRFPEGFDVIMEVEREAEARFVLPCSVQLLIENATKHNAVSAENPLTIKVAADGDMVRVSNNIVPKLTAISSTGLGHKYIRQRYLDLSGKAILIRKTEDEYSVTLPLL